PVSRYNPPFTAGSLVTRRKRRAIWIMLPKAPATSSVRDTEAPPPPLYFAPIARRHPRAANPANDATRPPAADRPASASEPRPRRAILPAASPAGSATIDLPPTTLRAATTTPRCPLRAIVRE